VEAERTRAWSCRRYGGGVGLQVEGKNRYARYTVVEGERPVLPTPDIRIYEF
jgi:hypothetical protein